MALPLFGLNLGNNKTGGTTTPGIVAPTGSLGATVQNAIGGFTGASQYPGYKPTPSPGINQPMGQTAVSPLQNLSTPKNTLPPNQIAGTQNTQGQLQPIQQFQQPAQNAIGSQFTPGQALAPGTQVDAQGRIVSTQQAQPQVNPNANPYTATAPTYGGLIGSLATTAAQPSPAFTQAQTQAQQALADLQKSREQEAQALSLNAQTPIPLEFQQGRGQILQNQYLQQQQAYAGTYQGATAQMGAATSQQLAQQGGLAQAGGLAQPMAAPALGFYNPATGQFTQYGGGQGGGAATAGGVTQQMQQGASVQAMTGQQSQAQTLAQNLNTLLDQSGINPTMPGGLSALQGVASQLTQWIDKNTGDPQYQNYANLINEISSRYASILNQSGGTPTDQSTLSHQIINALASGQDLKTVLSQLDKNASDSINALRGAATRNAVTTSNTQTGTTSGTTFGNFFGQ